MTQIGIALIAFALGLVAGLRLRDRLVMIRRRRELDRTISLARTIG